VSEGLGRVFHDFLPVFFNNLLRCAVDAEDEFKSWKFTLFRVYICTSILLVHIFLFSLFHNLFVIQVVPRSN
jgi:hypothetical protein